jgi:hypothetical protein
MLYLLQPLREAPVEARVVVLHRRLQLRHPGQLLHLPPLPEEEAVEAQRLLHREASNRKRARKYKRTHVEIFNLDGCSSIEAIRDRWNQAARAIYPFMKYLAWIVALFVVTVGVAGIVAPDRVMGLRLLVATQGALFVIGAVRMAIGIVLIMGAPGSRAPKTLRIVGAVIMLAGVGTPLFGIDRIKAILEWEVAQGPELIRVGGVVALAIGGFLAFALIPRKATSAHASGSSHLPL